MSFFFLEDTDQILYILLTTQITQLSHIIIESIEVQNGHIRDCSMVDNRTVSSVVFLKKKKLFSLVLMNIIYCFLNPSYAIEY